MSVGSRRQGHGIPLFPPLREMIVVLVAVFAFAGKSGEAIELGTIFGQPFMAFSLSHGLVAGGL